MQEATTAAMDEQRAILHRHRHRQQAILATGVESPSQAAVTHAARSATYSGGVGGGDWGVLVTPKRSDSLSDFLEALIDRRPPHSAIRARWRGQQKRLPQHLCTGLLRRRQSAHRQ